MPKANAQGRVGALLRYTLCTAMYVSARASLPFRFSEGVHPFFR